MIFILFFTFLLNIFASEFVDPISENLTSSILFIGSGAHTPIFSIPELDNKIRWLMENNQETSSGLKQLYLLGRYYRKLYIEDSQFLNETLNISEFEIRSLDKNKNLLAAQAFSLGLFYTGAEKLTPEQIHNESLWLPPFQLSMPDYIKSDLNNSAIPFNIPLIPIYAVNSSSEKLLSFENCPKYAYEWHKFTNTTSFNSILTKYGQTMQKICSQFELNCQKFKTIETIFSLVDYMISAEFHEKINLSQEILNSLNELYFDIFIEFIKNSESARTIVLHNFTEILIRHFDNAIHNFTNATEKMLIFSTDENIIFQYLIALSAKITELKNIPYASFAEFKLFSEHKNQYVSVFLNSEEISEKIEYDKFKDKLRKIGNSTASWDYLCKISN